MTAPYDPNTRWNIFVRELERMLNKRNLTVTRLDDLKVVTHPMKIKRLKASLTSPRSLTTLNPEEMELLEEKLALTTQEMMILRAALLATAVEKTLMDRIDPYLALMAANDVYRHLHQAMLANPQSNLATVFKDGAMSDEGEMFGDKLFEAALDLTDRASLAMHLSRDANASEAKITYAREAYDAYTRALDSLQRSRVPAHLDEDWRQCETEVKRGQAQARDIVRQGGEDL